MKNLHKRVLLLMMLLIFAIGFENQLFSVKAFSPINVNLSDNQQLIISDLKATPASYNPLSHGQVIISFMAKNTLGKHFSATIFDSTNEMMRNWGNRDLDEGLNTIVWNIYSNPNNTNILEDGIYKFILNAPVDPNMESKEYQLDIKVSRPDFKELIISDIQVNPNPYKPAAGPATISFNAQNVQNRHYAIAIVDSVGGILEQEQGLHLQEGLNTWLWYGSSQLLKSDTYHLWIVTPLGSNSKQYSLDFPVEN